MLIEAEIGQLTMDVNYLVSTYYYLHILSSFLTWPILVAKVYVTYRYIGSIPGHARSQYHHGSSALV